MGFVVKTVKLMNPFGSEPAVTLDLLVDTGAMFSIIPAVNLEQLGVRRLIHRKFRMIDGSLIERDLGPVTMEYEGLSGTIDVIFGSPDDHPVLGVLSLEAMGLEVDPVNNELRPMQMLLL